MQNFSGSCWAPGRVMRARPRVGGGRRPFLRFLLSGGVNTLLTYALYLLLMKFMPYWLAYSASFTTGIGLTYALNRLFVFGEHRGVRSFLGLPLVYGIQYVIGLLLLWLWVVVAGLDARLGPLISAAITAPLTFFMTRSLFVERP